MRLKTSSAENRKQPSRLRSSVWVERGETIAQVVENAGVGIEFLVLILREVVGLDVVAEAVFAVGQRLVRRPAVLMSVDLPAPLTPTSAMRSPRSMMKLTSRKTSFSP